MSQCILLVNTLGGRRVELTANAAITPGHLIERMSTGKARKHATAKGYAVKMFALEDANEGKTIADDYAANTPVQAHIAAPGEDVQGWLKVGESVVIGDKLVSAGDGTFQKWVAPGDDEDPPDVLAEANAALDLSGGGAVVTRLSVRIM